MLRPLSASTRQTPADKSRLRNSLLLVPVITGVTHSWTDNCAGSRDAAAPWPAGSVSAAWTALAVAIATATADRGTG